MNIKKTATKIIAIALAAASIGTIAAIPASAAVYTNQTVTRISNPEGQQRQTDGLVEGGDRENSYAWCMAVRGDYLYIGTAKNIGAAVVNNYANILTLLGMSEENVWRLADVVSNGDVPHPTAEEGGQIIKVNCKTGDMEVIYTAPKGVSFRMAITHGDNVYFGSYCAGANIVTDSEQGVTNDIFCIDEEDNITSVYSTANGTSMRAACEFEGSLYFGGIDDSEELAEGYDYSEKLAILRMREDDNTKWERVADYKDFGIYAEDMALKNAAASPIWDMCAYNGDIYATLPGSKGFVMFKGHPAKAGETANEYGWVWQEVVGTENGINDAGLRPAGAPFQKYLSIVATPVVYKDELYVFDFDHTLGAETDAISGLLKSTLGFEIKASDFLKPMYGTLRHPQSLWKLNNETGAFEKVQGFTDLVEGTTNEYIWRAEVYNDQLYLTTMDSATIYNYITKLTDGNFINMTKEEWEDQIKYILDLSILLIPDGSVEMATAKSSLEAAAANLQALLDEASESGNFEDYVEDFQKANEMVNDAVAALEKALANKATYEKLVKKISETNSIVAAGAVASASKMIDYLRSKGILDKLIPQDMSMIDFCQLSDEQLMGFFNANKEMLLSQLEKMKIDLPELKMLNTDEILSMIISEIYSIIQSEQVQSLVARMKDLKEKKDTAASMIKETYDNIIHLFFTDLPEETPEPENEETQEVTDETEDNSLSNRIKNKIMEAIFTGVMKSIEALDQGVQKYNEKAEAVNAYIRVLEQKMAEVSDKSQKAVNAIDWEGLAMYAYISSMVRNDKWGFDIIRTSDGEHFELVTDDGFGDKYNYGGRSMAATPYGLFLGTANPFYGAQLYRINDVLTNTSTVESETVTLGSEVVINAAAEYGKEPYTFEYFYKRSTNTKWNALKKNTFKPTAVADYDVKTVVTDAEGNKVEKIMSVNVVEAEKQLENNSWLVSDKVQIGDDITVTGAADGGDGEYTYAFYYKRSTNSKWYRVGEEFGSTKRINIVPKAAADYDIKVVVKDGDGHTETKLMTVTSYESLPLTNVSFINTPTEVPVNKTVTISGRAVGGEKPRTYQYFFKRSENSKWNTITAATEKGTYAKFTPTKAASYDLKVIATDSAGTTSEKVITISST